MTSKELRDRLDHALQDVDGDTTLVRTLAHQLNGRVRGLEADYDRLRQTAEDKDSTIAALKDQLARKAAVWANVEGTHTGLVRALKRTTRVLLELEKVGLLDPSWRAEPEDPVGG